MLTDFVVAALELSTQCTEDTPNAMTIVQTSFQEFVCLGVSLCCCWINYWRAYIAHRLAFRMHAGH
jgi:hypothetical protein